MAATPVESALDGQLPDQLHTQWRWSHRPGQYQHSRRPRTMQQLCISRIDLNGRSYAVDAAVHHTEQQTTGLPRFDQGNQLAQVFLPTQTDRVREGARAATQP